MPLGAPKRLLTATEIDEAWQWFMSRVPARPSPPYPDYCFNELDTWNDDLGSRLLVPTREVSIIFSRLYLLSQFSSIKILTAFVNGQAATPLFLYGQMEERVRAVISNPKRFRAALAEHIAFWMQLGLAARRRKPNVRFAATQPNFQPEIQGPDGLYLETGTPHLIEVISVKNSTKNPQKYISSPSFRRSGKASRGKQLDDFWLLVNKDEGFVQLKRLLETACDSLGLTVTEKLQAGLLRNTICNAVVVADHRHSDSQLFLGYNRIGKVSERRIATYIGSSKWSSVSSCIRNELNRFLKSKGIR